MGYTHHWTRKGDIAKDAWEKAMAAFNWALINKPEYSYSAGEYYSDDLLGIDVEDYGPDALVFNGLGDGLDHETFGVCRGIKKDEAMIAFGKGSYRFCKTARKPYDLFVVVALHIIHNFAPQNVIPYWPGYDPECPTDGTSESTLEDIADGIALGNLAIAVIEAGLGMKGMVDVQAEFDMRHSVNEYGVSIGVETFETLQEYDLHGGGGAERLESQIQQLVDGISWAEVKYSNDPFDMPYGDTIAVCLLAREATEKRVNAVRRVVQNVIADALCWKAKQAQALTHKGEKS
jgi:hypothetical protein